MSVDGSDSVSCLIITTTEYSNKLMEEHAVVSGLDGDAAI